MIPSEFPNPFIFFGVGQLWTQFGQDDLSHWFGIGEVTMGETSSFQVLVTILQVFVVPSLAIIVCSSDVTDSVMRIEQQDVSKLSFGPEDVSRPDEMLPDQYTH